MPFPKTLRAIAKNIQRTITGGRSKSAVMEGSSETDSNSHASFHPFLRLPKELRLMVYESLSGFKRQRLPLRGANIYVDELDLAILQTCRLVSSEATSILRRRLSCLPQPPTFTVRAYPSKYDVSLYYTRHLLRLISEGRAADIEEDGSSTEFLLPWLFCGSVASKLRIEDLSSTKLPPGSPIKDGVTFQTFYRRKMKQLQHDSTIVVRLLLDTPTKDDPFAVASFWLEVGIHLRPFARMIKFRFVFFVAPQHYEHCKQLASEPGAFPTWFTEDMWAVEVSNGRCDPAVD